MLVPEQIVVLAEDATVVEIEPRRCRRPVVVVVAVEASCHGKIVEYVRHRRRRTAAAGREVMVSEGRLMVIEQVVVLRLLLLTKH